MTLFWTDYLNTKVLCIFWSVIFNLVLNPELDCQNYLHLNNLNARDKVHSIISELNLIGVCRENNIEKREYTWF
jgi:hypothetical protein